MANKSPNITNANIDSRQSAYSPNPDSSTRSSKLHKMHNKNNDYGDWPAKSMLRYKGAIKHQRLSPHDYIHNTNIVTIVNSI